MPTPVIIDTDPGVDDVLALLLALADSPHDLQVLLVSVTFGNVEAVKSARSFAHAVANQARNSLIVTFASSCLRNVVSLFHVLEQELKWRRERGFSGGFQSLQDAPPLVALGADGPLGDQLMLADYFREAANSTALTPIPRSCQLNERKQMEKTGWAEFTKAHLFASSLSAEPSSPPVPGPNQDSDHADPVSALARGSGTSALFKASQNRAHIEILRLLEEYPPDTIDIIAIGPLTNIALAASKAPQTLMRAKSILVMGGAIAIHGNMTPLAEFNIYADTTAAARVFALTSPTPASTMPVIPDVQSLRGSKVSGVTPLPPYPPRDQLGSKRLNVVLFPLDLTDEHTLRRTTFLAKIKPLLEQGSPLAEWVNGILLPTFKKMELLHHGNDANEASISLHDPMCIWYAMKCETMKDQWELNLDEDIRVETSGQWTRGACIIDRRDRRKRDDPNDTGEGQIKGDTDGWLSSKRGNRLKRCVSSPGQDLLGFFMLDTIFA